MTDRWMPSRYSVGGPDGPDVHYAHYDLSINLRPEDLKEVWMSDEKPTSPFPEDAAARKAVPLAAGLLDYFPAALIEVARVSKAGNDQHNPGQPLHWSRGKSTDHADTILRHLVDRGHLDTDGVRHTAKVAWRALALLQEELEAAGSPPGRGSKFPPGAKWVEPPKIPDEHLRLGERYRRAAEREAELRKDSYKSPWVVTGP